MLRTLPKNDAVVTYHYNRFVSLHFERYVPLQHLNRLTPFVLLCKTVITPSVKIERHRSSVKWLDTAERRAKLGYANYTIWVMSSFMVEYAGLSARLSWNHKRCSWDEVGRKELRETTKQKVYSIALKKLPFHGTGEIVYHWMRNIDKLEDDDLRGDERHYMSNEFCYSTTTGPMKSIDVPTEFLWKSTVKESLDFKVGSILSSKF